MSFLKSKAIKYIALGCCSWEVFAVIFIALFVVAFFSGGASTVENGNFNTTTCSSAKIPKGAMENINKNMSIYKSAAAKTNVPWEMLAAIHFREHNNSRITPNTNTNDGVYQIVSKNYPYLAGERLDDEAFLQESIDAGEFLQSKANNKLTPEITNAAIIKDAFWGYNGRTYGSADNSPYVMNNFDDNHKNMPIITHDGGKIDGVDTRNGAYTTFVILKGNCS